MNEENAGWDYKPDGETKLDSPSLNRASNALPRSKKNSSAEPVTWTASEYIDHSRGFSWYVVLSVGTAVLSAVVYLITKDIFATIITALVGVVVWVFSLRKPQEITYKLSQDGLEAGNKTYNYSQFKSFSIIREGGLYSINLMPIKKFMPIITVYFEPNQEEKIVNIVGQHLAYEQRGMDSIERLTRRLRF